MLGARDEVAHVDPRARGLTPDHPAYLIYTSGSTGTPKGIVVSHRNICHFLRAGNEIYGLTGEDVVFQGASVAFDLSMEEIWIPYLVGATLIVASPEMMGDAEKLPDLLTQAGVTVLDTVPTLLALLPRDVPGVRVILLGGEALPAPLIARWARPDRRIFNTYGPTEATVVATVAEVQPGETVTIGRPIPNYTAYICDEALRIVAPGEQGELVIGGPGVAQGYLRRPELTAEKFVANPSIPRRRTACCIARAMRSASMPTATSCFTAASTIRSRCAASASSLARSRRGWRTSRASRMRPSSCAMTMAWTGSWPSSCRPAARPRMSAPCAPPCARRSRPTWSRRISR